MNLSQIFVHIYRKYYLCKHKCKAKGIIIIKMRSIICLSIILAIVTLPMQVNATDGNHRDYSPKTPEAWSFQQMADIPVGNYTGTLNMSIPLYTVECGDLEVPISLDYLGSAIKVDQEATWVGLNWMLNAGGAITTRLSVSYDCSNGTPDGWKAEWRHLLNHLSLTAIYPTGSYDYKIKYKFDGQHPYCGGYGREWFKKTLEVVDTTNFPNDIPYHLYGIILNHGDGESPTYQANFMGHHVSFIYDRLADEYFITGNAEGYQIVKGGLGPTITDRNGVKYHFNEIEIGSVDDASVNPDFRHLDYTYYLTKIESPTGRYILFRYRKENTQHGLYKIQETLYSEEYPVNILEDIHSQSLLNKFHGLGGGELQGGKSSVLRTHSPQYKFEPKRLSSIETDAGLKVVFNPNTERRLDIRDVDHSLKNIEIKVLQPDGTYKLLRRFCFQYSYFPKNTVGGNVVQDAFGSTYSDWFSNDDFMYYRLRLDKVWEEAIEGTILKKHPAYSFSYSDKNLPGKASAAIDYWGYYNGKENFNGTYHTMLPRGWNNNTSDDASLFPDASLAYYGADRRPDGNCAQACLLTSVSYPTGAVASFIYEPNTFNNYTYYEASSSTSTVSPVAHFPTRMVYTSNQSGYSTSGEGVYKEQTEFAISNTLELDLELSYSKSNMTKPAYWNHIIFYPALIFKLSESNQVLETSSYQYMPSDTTISDNHLTKTVSIVLQPGKYRLAVPAMSTSNQSEAFYQMSAQLNIHKVPQEQPDLESEGCGIRIKSVTISGDGTAVKTSYEYQNENGKSSGMLMSRAVFARKKLLLYQSTSYQNIGGNIVYPLPPKEIRYWILSGDNLAVPAKQNVCYSQVTISKSSGTQSNGKSIYKYYNHRWGNGSMWDYMRRTEDPRNGMLLSKADYDSDNQLIHKVSNSYEMKCMDSRLLNAVVENVYSGGNSVTGGNALGSSNAYADALLGGCMMIYLYPSVQFAMKKTTTIDGDYVDGIPMEKSLSTTYNLRNNMDSVTVESHSRSNETIVTEKLYPTDYTNNNVAAVLKNSHIIGVPMEQAKSVIDADGNNVVEDTRITYDPAGQPLEIYQLNQPYPVSRGSFKLSNEHSIHNLHEKVETISYNSAHRPRTVTSFGLLPVTYIWGYSNQFPIAVVEGAFENSVINALGGAITVDILESSVFPTMTPESLHSTLASIPGALVTVYEHSPYVGVVKKIAPNGEQTTYDYDSFSRLIQVKDLNGVIMNQFNYHYRKE